METVAGTGVIEWWLRQGAVYGVAVLFLVCSLGIILLIAISILRTLNKWLPLWFEKSIESHQKVIDFLDDYGVRISNIDGHTSITSKRFEMFLRAINAGLSDKEVQQRLGIKSDVIIQLRAAEMYATGTSQSGT